MFTFLDGVREKRGFKVRTVRYCTAEDGRSIEHCAFKTGGFNFGLQCRYEHAHRFYVANCTDIGGGVMITFNHNCDTVHREVNVNTMCCKGIC